MRVAITLPLIDALVLVGAEELVEIAFHALVLSEIEVGGLLGARDAALGALLVEGRVKGAVHQAFVRCLGSVVVLNVLGELSDVNQFLVVGRSDVLVSDAQFFLVVENLVFGADHFFSLAHLILRVKDFSFLADHFLYAGLKFLTESLILRTRSVHLHTDVLFPVVVLVIFTF